MVRHSQERPTVAVLGGGIGGLSAAQELAERGFNVTVYELRERFGGKARSIPVPDSAAEGRKPLVGEHGFRFFPGFYTHLIDTMDRIPYENSRSVADNLVATENTLVASTTDQEVTQSTETPTSVREWFEALQPFGGVGVREGRHFAESMLTFLTSCEARRQNEYEYISWWDFIRANERSESFQKHLAQSTQALVALRPEQASARTVGRIFVQLLIGQLSSAKTTERVLNGPTSDVWIDPWVNYLEELNVDLQTGQELTDIHLDSRRQQVVSVSIRDKQTQGSAERKVTADYYVLAVPVEAAADIVDDDLRHAARSLATLERLETAWMNGIQFYLSEDISIARGHSVYSDSPWALTSISQQQFWADHDIAERGNERINGVLSVIASDWSKEGVLYNKPAWDCTREQIKDEIWAQLKAHLNRNGTRRLSDEMLVDWFLDPAIVEAPDKKGVENREPLLINTTGSLRYRPEAQTGVDNLMLAADYVRTNTDLATMESANEAARRATNAIINQSNVPAQPCEMWPLEEPSVFEPFKRQDRLRYQLGLSHPGEAVNQVRQTASLLRF